MPLAPALLPGLLTALALGSGSGAPLARPAEPGNILILIADDLGIDQIGAYGVGSDPAPTPTLDLIAGAGVLFRNAWSQPTCSPTRASIQTGRFAFRTSIGTVINPFSNGPALPLSEVTLPEMLDLGTGGLYAHAAIGKWHLGSAQTGADFAPNLAGYSHFAGSLEGQIGNYFNWRRVVNGSVAQSTRYATTSSVNDGLAWIRQQDGPWLCVVSFQAPHAPFHRPPPRLHSQVLPPGTPPISCDAPGPDPRPFYKAAVEALDHEIGRMIFSLPAGELAQTTVFFLADNGTDRCLPQAPFTSDAKGTLYEGGVRVPLLVAGLGVVQGGECAALVGVTDLFATVAELAGVDLAATLPGVVLDSVSFAPCLADPAQSSREWLFAEAFSHNGPGNPPVLPPCPAADVCQTSLGFDGPGSATLTSCGPPLYGVYGANVVPWQLSGAPPFAETWLVIGSFAPAWQPQLGAWLVSPPPNVMLSYYTGGSGTLAGATWTPSSSFERYYQFIVRDLSQPLGFSVSNALRMDLLPTHSRAVRGPRYKLIRFDPCSEEFYDLAQDPFEHTDLLARALTVSERAAYDSLAQRLALLH